MNKNQFIVVATDHTGNGLGRTLMFRVFRHYIPKTLVLLGFAEVLILLVSIFVGASFSVIANGGAVGAVISSDPKIIALQATVFCVAMLLGMIAMGFYQRDQRDGPVATMVRLLLSFAVGFLVMGAVYFTIPQLVLGGTSFLVALASSFVGIATCRILCFSQTDTDLSRRVLVLGVGERARQIQNLRRASDKVGITIVGYVDIGSDERIVQGDKLIPLNGNLLDVTDKYAVDEIVVAIDDRRKGLPLEAILECKMAGVSVIEAPTFFERQLGKIRLDAVHPSNMIFAEGYTHAVIKRGEKRLVDILLALGLLIITLPLFAIVALAVMLESGAPILYRQERVGLNGKPFTLLKFRSMCADAEKDGVAQWANDDDDRITRVGCILRKFRLDELPQLINVLRGEMSFVGPRPERPQFVDELKDVIPYYELRHYVKPGITGWAQVCYPYGASINDSREKLQYDLYYLKNYSVFLDINILLLTVQVILWGKGAR